MDLEEETQEAPSDPAEETREAPSDRNEETREEPPNPKETREVPLDPKEETREVPLDPEVKTREVLLGPKQEKQEAPSNPAEETREAPLDREDGAQKTRSDQKRRHWKRRRILRRRLEAPSDSEEETKYVAGLAEGPMHLEGPVVLALRKLTISVNLPPNNVKAHACVEGAAPQSSLPTNEEGNKSSVSMCDRGGTMIFQRKAELPEPMSRGMSPGQLTGRRR